MRRVLLTFAILLLLATDSSALQTRIQLAGATKDHVTLKWKIRGARPGLLGRSQLEIQNKNPYTNRFELVAIVLSPVATGVVVAPLRYDTAARAKVVFRSRKPSLSNAVDVPSVDEELGGDELIDEGGLFNPPSDSPQIPSVPYSTELKDGRTLCERGVVADTLHALNVARSSMGLQILNEDPILSRAALAHSNWMAEVQTMSHEGWFERYLLSGGALGAVAQNIAKAVRTSSELANGWLESPYHRDNILSIKYTKTGISCVASKDGTYYWSHYFGA